MNTNINIELINKQTTSKKKFIEECNTQKIILYNFFSVNNIRICEKITKIPYYANNFYIIKECDFIKIGNINEKLMQIDNKLNINEFNELTNKQNKYLLLKYDNINRIIQFNDFLFNLPTPKLLIFHVLESFSYLSRSLIKLNEIEICFFELSSENLFFNENFKPILRNFEKSLSIDKLDRSYISTIIEGITDFTYKPIEIHVLFYLIVNNEETLSYTFIETICKEYIKNMTVLSLFSQQYIDTYEIYCMKFLQLYINKPKSFIINELLNYYDTWDNYSLSVLYLHLIGAVCRAFSLKGTFLNKFIHILLKNINPDPSKRDHLDETLFNYEKLYNEFIDWSFITQLSNSKMEKVYELLEN